MNARLHVVFLAVGCTADTKPLPLDSAPPPDTADSAAPTADTADTASPPAAPRCPDDMVPVPTDLPTFCIDRYEASLADTHLASVADVLPHVGVTFEEARDLCAATPVVVDGQPVGYRRLATLIEWADAADGTLGEGGATFPTGEDWPEGTCAVLTASGEQVVDTLQPTGSFPDCQSAFGTVDQLGNAWEWADPALDIHIAAFLAAQDARGVGLTVDSDGTLWSTTGTPAALQVEVPGLFAGVSVAEDGRVVAADVTFQATEPFDYVGFLVSRDDISRTHTGFALPVRITREDAVPEAAFAPLTVRLDQDGAPLTAKVGCAYYSGQPGGCTTADWFFGHPPDFRGTIGIRCAADPID